MSRPSVNANSASGRMCRTPRCDIAISHTLFRCNRNAAPIPPNRSRTHQCINTWAQCQAHSAHWRRRCSDANCPDRHLPCQTCADVPPYGPPAPCTIEWVQCANGPVHGYPKCTLNGCQVLVPPCARCNPPAREVYVLERDLTWGFVQSIANRIGRAVKGSATHWVVIVTEPPATAQSATTQTDSRGMSQFELAKANLANSATLSHVHRTTARHMAKNMGGVTHLADEEIQAIAKSIISVSPYYQLRTASCQTFAVDLALRVVESPTKALLEMKAEQTRLRMKKGGWDEGTLDRSVGQHRSVVRRELTGQSRDEIQVQQELARREKANSEAAWREFGI